MKIDIHYLCKTNLGLLLLSSSERVVSWQGDGGESYSSRTTMLKLKQNNSIKHE